MMIMNKQNEKQFKKVIGKNQDGVNIDISQSTDSKSLIFFVFLCTLDVYLKSLCRQHLYSDEKPTNHTNPQSKTIAKQSIPSRSKYEFFI